jgi:hypothetical protein
MKALNVLSFDMEVAALGPMFDIWLKCTATLIGRNFLMRPSMLKLKIA